MAKKFSLRQFLIDKAAITAGEYYGILPKHTGEFSMAYMLRKPAYNLVRTASLVPRVAAHLVLPTPTAPPVTQSYTGIRGGHPGNIGSSLTLGTVARTAIRYVPIVAAVAFFATLEQPGTQSGPGYS